MWRWTARGFALGGRKASTFAGRAVGWLLLAGLSLMAPVLLPLWFFLAYGRPRARYYMSPARDAVLAVSASRRGWTIGEHVCAQPGQGLGRELRKTLLPHLVGVVDEAGITVHAVASDQRVAEQYAAELPGLEVVGRSLIPGRLIMRRDPQTGVKGTR